jgi:lipoate-protein ligase B
LEATRNHLPQIKVNRTWLCADLPLTDYKEAWNLQLDLLNARIEGVFDRNVVLILEHPPVFTLGRRGGLENLRVPRNFIENSGIEVVQVERGGNITYHGPGQIVIYPIVDLKRGRIRVVDYVCALEEVMIRTASDWGVRASRNSLNRGVWVENRKLGSIGIAVRRGISFHGLAFNANLDMMPFTFIQPCGLQGIGVTSLEGELSRKVNMARLRKAMRRHMEEVLGIELVMIALEELEILLSQGRLGAQPPSSSIRL